MALKTGIPASELRRRWTSDDLDRAMMVMSVRTKHEMWKQGLPVQPNPVPDYEFLDQMADSYSDPCLLNHKDS